ncbi:MAG: acetolactate decarboxylase [Kiritimatiellia bacterium]
MKKWVPSLFLALIVLGSGCATPPRDTLYQTSTIDALLAGVYDGDLTCRRLLDHGDFGIGTFDRLEGEMIVLDGAVWQIKADGRVYSPNLETTTPFAAVCRFTPERHMALDTPADIKGAQALLDRLAPNKNLFCAIRITGQFKRMKTRSVPGQTRPYRPLKEVTARQPEFDMESVAGTVLGFRCPPFVNGVNVPGYHLHFLSADRTRGGHILDFELEKGVCEIDTLSRFCLRLPENGSDFAKTDLSKDRRAEMQDVER